LCLDTVPISERQLSHALQQGMALMSALGHKRTSRHVRVGRALCGAIPSGDCEVVAQVILGAEVNNQAVF
jgi:hypothetical protein